MLIIMIIIIIIVQWQLVLLMPPLRKKHEFAWTVHRPSVVIKSRYYENTPLRLVYHSDSNTRALFI